LAWFVAGSASGRLSFFSKKLRNKQVTNFCACRRDAQHQCFQDFLDERNLLVSPPWYFLYQALNKLRQDQATALACVPVRRSFPWCPMVDQVEEDYPSGL